ncbi:hypothetical protein BTO28_07615, partial [Domibacillus epiphyticus]
VIAPSFAAVVIIVIVPLFTAIVIVVIASLFAAVVIIVIEVRQRNITPFLKLAGEITCNLHPMISFIE